MSQNQKPVRMQANPKVLDMGIEYLLTRVQDCTETIPEYDSNMEYNAVAAAVLIASRWRFNQVSGNPYFAYGRKLDAFTGIYERISRAAELAKKAGLEPPPNYSTMEPNRVSSNQYTRLDTGEGDGKKYLPIDARFDWMDVFEGLTKALPELSPKKEIPPELDTLERVNNRGEVLTVQEVNFNKSVDSLWAVLNVS